MKRKTKSIRRTIDNILAQLSPLAQFVRTRREELGYTQEELAFRTGLSNRFIKEFELGKKTVRLDKVTYLLNYLGADIAVKRRY